MCIRGQFTYEGKEYGAVGKCQIYGRDNSVSKEGVVFVRDGQLYVRHKDDFLKKFEPIQRPSSKRY